MATVRIPSSLHAQMPHSAISPRFAIRIFLNMNQLSALSRQLSLRLFFVDVLGWKHFLSEEKSPCDRTTRRAPAETRGFTSSAGWRTTPAHIQWAGRCCPSSLRFRRPHPTRSHSAVSSPQRCTVPAPLPPYPDRKIVV